MKRVKIVLSMLCAVACLLSCAFVPSVQTVVAADDVPTGLREIYPCDFGIEDGYFSTRHNNKTVEGLDSLLGTIFTMDFRYISGDRIWIMYAAPSEWYGLSFRFMANKKTFVLADDTSTYLKKTIRFDPDIAGVDFFNETFRIQISLEAVDNDGLGEKNDLKIGVFFNHKLYNGEYIYQNDTALLLGKSLWLMPLLSNAEKTATYEISSPVNNNSGNYFKTVPADFGIDDGDIDTTVQMPIGLDGKYFSVNTSLNIGEYINYAGLKLSREDSGEITFEDSTGNNSFSNKTKHLDANDALTPITYSDFGIADNTYTYNKNDIAVRNSYKNGDTLDGTYFSAKIKFHDGEGSSIAEMRYGGNDSGAWTGIWTQFNAGKIVVRDTKTNVAQYTFTPADVGLDTFENTEFVYGISIRFVDIDNDGLENDLQYGIWVNDELVQDKYAYVNDISDYMGKKTALYCSGSADSADNSTITVASVSSESSVITQQNGIRFPLEEEQKVDFFTKRTDTDFDGDEDDLVVVVFIDDNKFADVNVTDYKTKLNDSLSIKGKISSPDKQLSYKTQFVTCSDSGMEEFTTDNQSGAVDIDIKTKNIVSGKVTEIKAEGKLTLDLKQNLTDKLSLNDFGVSDGAYSSSNVTSGQYNGDLDEAVFTANFKFANNNPVFYYGGTAENSGIKFQLNNGVLNIYDASGAQLDSITAAKAGIGTTFRNAEFDLGIASAFVDNDDDGEEDDLKLAVWFNGVYYNTYSLNNGVSSFGNYVTLTSATTSKVTVVSEYFELPLENAPFDAEANESDVEDYILNERCSFDIEYNATDLDDDGIINDIAVNVYIDGKHSDTKFYKNCFKDNTLSGFIMNFETVDAAVCDRVPEESLPTDEIYSLYGDPYLVVGCNEIYVNRTTDYKVGDIITTPGEYVFVRVMGGVEYTQKVALWKYGHANNDNEINILDFVAMNRYIAGESKSELCLKSTDFDANGDLTASDLSLMKRYLLGLAELPEYTERTDRWSFSEDVMPIVGYYGPLMQTKNSDGSITDVNGISAYDTVTDKVYKAIAESGVNTISYFESVYRTSVENTTLRNLKLASKYGLGVSVNMGAPSDATDAEFAALLGKFSHFTSFRGLFIKDEPSTELLKDLAARSTMANRFANLYGYINLYPTYVSSTAVPDYAAYVEEYCSTCNPKMLSWDHYVMENYKVNYSNKNLAMQRYFNNLNIIRNAALKYEIPFWGFLQTGDANGVGDTKSYTGTKEDMMWNLNTQLAFGAKGIQYFTLVQPNFYAYGDSTNPEFDYNAGGIVGANGEKTQYFYHAVAANKQIAAIDHILMNCESKDVLAIGDNAKSHTGINKTAYGSVTGVSSNEEGSGFIFKTTDGAIVGCFDYNGKEAYYIVNYDLADTHDITVTLDGTHKFTAYSATQNGEAGSGSSYTASLGAGEAVLIVLD